ncbi:MAG: hypothetical protein KGD64_10680 [Candidatus Heimdallarchaeota archaeon]|nr:hypothetical protein [Candidatus Heimdallarchaeota archaeon]
MKSYEMDEYLDQQVMALERELKQLKRARRARKAKAQASKRYGGHPATG